MDKLCSWDQVAIVWEHSGDGEFPYRARVDGRTYTIRVNDFPAEPLYTLLIDSAEVGDLGDWPSAWIRPEIPRTLLDMVERKGGPA